VEGGKEGFQVALRIIPFLVAMLVAVGMLRASGAVDLMVAGLSPITSLIGMPAETLPMALVRTLSGSGAFAVAAEIMQVHGPDSLIGNMVSTMQGSSDTTFYVLAVYFGVAGIKNTRHTLPSCLAADAAGALAAVWFTRLILG
ncbi:MAG: nucleoside recognition domain-containing protein, partial [Myxococcota bacterium]